MFNAASVRLEYDRFTQEAVLVVALIISTDPPTQNIIRAKMRPDQLETLRAQIRHEPRPQNTAIAMKVTSTFGFDLAKHDDGTPKTGGLARVDAVGIDADATIGKTSPS